MKLVVLTDAHGNLPALKAVLRQVRAEGYDLLVHTGDAVAIGPYSRECVHLLHGMPKTELVMGNHDAWLAHGLPSPNPPWLTTGEAEHHFWLSTAFPPEEKKLIGKWPYELTLNCEGVHVKFVHYGFEGFEGFKHGTGAHSARFRAARLNTGKAPSLSSTTLTMFNNSAAQNSYDERHEFKPIISEPTGADLDIIFQKHDADLLFYGHDHAASDRVGQDRVGQDRVGQTHYINPGSLGCYCYSLARYVVVEFKRGTYTIDYRSAPYDDLDLVRAFEDRKIPERELIYESFFGGRISAETLYQL